MAYIGEADPVIDRLLYHYKDKDWWTTVVFFVSKDRQLNKAHVQYLEAKLVQLARSANRCRLENANQPAEPSLSEMDHPAGRRAGAFPARRRRCWCRSHPGRSDCRSAASSWRSATATR